MRRDGYERQRSAIFPMTYNASTDPLIERLKAEFLEMPGLKLTEAQAQRMWSLDATLCSSLLETLVNTSILFRTRDSASIRIERITPSMPSLATHSKPS